MSGTTSTRWFWSDWMSDPGLRACSYAARGLWKDLLCIAGANKAEYGFVSLNGKRLDSPAIAKMTNGTVEEVEPLLAELDQNGVFSRDRRGIIYCRRMVRAEKNRSNGRLGGRPDLLEIKKNRESVGKKAKPHIPEPEPERVEDTPQLALRSASWPRDFREQFWQRFPLRVGKAKAMRGLETIKRGGRVEWAVLMAGVDRYVRFCVGTEKRFIKHPTTWLNQGCWDDELPTPSPTPNGGGGRPARENGWAAMLRDGMTEEIDGIGPDPRGAPVIDADPADARPR